MFKLDESGNITVLHEFGLFSVASPTSLVQGRDNSFYGIGSGGLGFGTVFKLDASGKISLLHTFDGSNGGASSPNPGLIEASDGSFYGTTASGGSSGGGAIFKLDLSGNVTLLHSFDFDSSEGYFPIAGLILANDGSLYGATQNGARNGGGTVFKLNATGKVNILHVFDDTNNGASSPSKLIQANDGNLYGTTASGGSHSAGTVFRLDKTGSFKILYSFDGASGGAYSPNGLIQGSDGNFYGTTTAGYIDYGTYLYGKLFKIDATGNFSVLHTFTDSFNNSTPNGNLIQASDGSLYGTTTRGGSSDLGTAFKLDPSGNLTVLHSFDEETGSEPTFGLIQAKDGSFYGTTYSGGPYWGGVIYRLIEPPDAAPIALDSSANPSLRGQWVTFTAAVTGNSPTGSVRFLKGTKSLGSVPLIDGVARLSTSRLKIGSHSITAVYSGDANNASVTSAPLVQVVKAATKKEPRPRPRGNWGRGNR